MDRNDIRNTIIEWGRGIPGLLTVAAVVQVRSASSVYEMMRLVRGEKGTLAVTRRFSSEAWFECYRNPGIVVREALLQLGVEVPEEPVKFEFGPEIMDQLKVFEPGLKNPQTRQWAIDGMWRTVAEMWFEHDESLLWELLEETEILESEEFDDASLCEAIALDVHCRFYIEVLLPCLMEYQERPEVLFKRAKNGDLKALEKLVRLDKWAASLPEWMEAMYSGNRNRDAKVQQTLAKAMEKAPPGKIDLSSVKVEIAGLIGRQFQSLGLEIDVRKVRELFDILARIDRDAERDIHLPDDNANFGKHLQRSKKRWRAYIPDMPKELQKAMKACQRQRIAASKPRRRKSA